MALSYTYNHETNDGVRPSWPTYSCNYKTAMAMDRLGHLHVPGGLNVASFQSDDYINYAPQRLSHDLTQKPRKTTTSSRLISTSTCDVHYKSQQ